MNDTYNKLKEHYHKTFIEMDNERRLPEMMELLQKLELLNRRLQKIVEKEKERK